jgi:SAM-dependent methyltransferase
MKKIIERKKCRVSGEKLTPLFTLGKLYLSDFLQKDETPGYEPVELKMLVAPKSGLVQLAHTVPGDVMYRKYWYKSGISNTMVAELKGIAEKAAGMVRAKSGDIWVDIGCNDGTLFKYVHKHFVKVGFDPNDFSEESSKHAHHICSDYFTLKNYQKTPYGKQKAKIITAIAMFYDLEDPNDFISNVANVLDKNGMFIIQMSYLPLMLKQLAFDNICHEHLEYYSLEALKFLLARHKMEVVDCELNDINGGSFRIYIRHKNADPTHFATAPYRDVAEMRVQSILDHEKTLKLYKKAIFQ